MLFIYPRSTPQEDSPSLQSLDDFLQQLKNTRDLVNRIPEPGPNRRLDYSTRRLTSSERDIFLALGNQLLVRITNVLNFIKQDSFRNEPLISID